jgi:RNA polymerase subunit RPABC4/transcription elongation factor Spt4
MGIGHRIWQTAVVLTSFRIHFSGLFLGIGIGFVANLIGIPEPALGPISVGVYVLFVAASAFGAAAGAATLNCPRCRKMVKMGSEVCHHCGNTELTATLQHSVQPIDPHATSAGDHEPVLPPYAAAPSVEATPRREMRPDHASLAAPEPSPRAFSPPAPPTSLAGEPSGFFDSAERRSVELAVPADVAFEKLREAMQRKGELKSANSVTRTLIGKMRYGASSVRLRVTVESGDAANTSKVAVAAEGQDVFGVAARKVSERLLDAIE